MAKTQSVNKSEFIRNAFKADPKVSLSGVQEQWKQAGNKDNLSGTLYYHQKSRLGIALKRRGRPRKSQAVMSESNGNETYLKIEMELDMLIAKAVVLKDSKIVEALRKARRRVSAELI